MNCPFLAYRVDFALSTIESDSFFYEVCPIQVQEEIASYLDQQEANFDFIISKFKKQIDLFKEYRTALISEAVTGKIDVRELELSTHR
ncbi:MAG: hypothetical protein D3922_07850 [Candidatus Electrothrix sp. AR1]|nr:hypothetical protein [Candidatus Electrothrix sp. AR1]